MAALPNWLTNSTFSISYILHVLTIFHSTAQDDSHWIAKLPQSQVQYGIFGG
jgi:hypothetical protein